MARRKGLAMLIGLPAVEPDTRKVGPLLNDLPPYGLDRNSNPSADPLKGGQLACSDVMSTREGVRREAPRIKTVSAWGAPREQERKFRERDEHGED